MHNLYAMWPRSIYTNIMPRLEYKYYARVDIQIFIMRTCNRYVSQIVDKNAINRGAIFWPSSNICNHHPSSSWHQHLSFPSSFSFLCINMIWTELRSFPSSSWRRWFVIYYCSKYRIPLMHSITTWPVIIIIIVIAIITVTIIIIIIIMHSI